MKKIEKQRIMNDVLQESIELRRNKLKKFNYEYASKGIGDDFLDEDTSQIFVPSDPKGPLPKISGEQKIP